MLFYFIIFAIAVGLLALVGWNVVAWPQVTRQAAEFSWQPDAISVLIPARNEEENLPACLASVLLQAYLVKEILIYDDHSTDGTRRIVQAFAESDERVRLIEALPLPDGWSGKNFACYQLAQHATGEWLLFLDADARLTDNAAERMLEEVHTRKLTFLSCWPGLTLLGFWEKALMPMLNFVVLTLFPAPLSLLRMDAALGLAHGACLLMQAKTYHRLGGHATVKEEIFEDTRLAQVWRASGERGLCLDGQAVVRVRMYDSLSGIWRGFQKNFYPAFRHDISFWLFLLLHFCVFFFPFVALIGSRADNAKLWFAFWAAIWVIEMRLLLALRFRYPLWTILLHPLAEVILMAVGLSSWWRCQTGRGVEWKGRRYRL